MHLHFACPPWNVQFTIHSAPTVLLSHIAKLRSFKALTRLGRQIHTSKMSQPRFAGQPLETSSTAVLTGADIAVNLTDPMYRGEYHGKTRHASDLDQVVDRARLSGVERILITGTSLQETKDALELAKKYSMSMMSPELKSRSILYSRVSSYFDKRD